MKKVRLFIDIIIVFGILTLIWIIELFTKKENRIQW